MSAQPTTEKGSTYDRKVKQLTALSEPGPYDAYEDVPWDEPGYQVDPTDERFELFSFDPLRRTEWYQQLEPIERARVGLQRIAVNLRIGWEFENQLQVGLLARAMQMDNSNVAFRYIQHEIAEEAHHSMMFYEFVRRYAPEVSGAPVPRRLRGLGGHTVQIGARRSPVLFFVSVLGGEVPIDHIQRMVLREESVHPLVERIMRIHVEEEARHVAYANQELRRLAPQLGAWQRHVAAMFIPLMLGVLARLMVFPSPWMRRHYGIPRRQIKQANRHPDSRQLLADSVKRIRTLCGELGLITGASKRLWKLAGIWNETDRKPAAA
jgi:hypothetical protein